MGAACSGGCCGQPTYRFKNYVVAVYPEEPQGEANLDALGKLKAYVGKNPERIPRVCRKVSKLIDRDIERNEVNNVCVGVLIVRELIDEATVVEYFVPHTVDLAVKLFAQEDAELQIAASDLVGILTFKIGDKPRMEPSRRQLAAHQRDLLRGLQAMAAEGAGTNDIESLHCRYAAIVALGNLFAALRTSLVDAVPLVMQSALLNLHYTLRDAAAQQGHGGGTARPGEGGLAGSGVTLSTSTAVSEGEEKMISQHVVEESGPIQKVALPMEANAKDAAYRKACVSLICALTASCSNATTPQLLRTTAEFFDNYNGWETPHLASMTYSAIAVSLQKRYQQGFTVCQKLMDLLVDSVHQTSGNSVVKVEAILGALIAVINVIPLTGVRPKLCVDALGSVLRSPNHPDSLYHAAVEAMRSLVQRTADFGNTAQLVAIASELIDTVARTQHHVLALVGLDVLTQTAGHFAAFSPQEKHKVRVIGGLRSYLTSKEEGFAYRALECLVQYIRGGSSQHQPGHHRAHPSLPPLLPEEVEVVHECVYRELEEDAITPQRLVALADLMLAFITRAQSAAVPWVLGIIFDLQAKLESETSGSSRCTTLQSAWHLFLLSCVRSLGLGLRITDLIDYATEIYRRRRNAEHPEIPPHFHARFESRASYSGLKVLPNEEEFPLDKNSHAATVTYLIVHSTTGIYLLQSGNIEELEVAFGVTTKEELTAIVEGTAHRRELTVSGASTSEEGGLAGSGLRRSLPSASFEGLQQLTAIVPAAGGAIADDASSIHSISIAPAGDSLFHVLEFAEPDSAVSLVAATLTARQHQRNSLSHSLGADASVNISDVTVVVPGGPEASRFPTISEELKAVTDDAASTPSSRFRPASELTGSSLTVPALLPAASHAHPVAATSLRGLDNSAVNRALSATFRATASLGGSAKATSRSSSVASTTNTLNTTLTNLSITMSRAKALRMPGVDVSQCPSGTGFGGSTTGGAVNTPFAVAAAAGAVPIEQMFVSPIAHEFDLY